ncbi:predicted protein [Naegleria gruberi]|uniref:Predicted protein n=1 Tax=Naegleria gruberi TaxID=5762 RepID=D2VVS6_NAEGR|nr:uncharacterized protein NAEGRDRAFT_52656 [Naegleria gruberi]EFC39091.1 predicted protein [Naegleria gruberi]|eukprot:XP_002671835.1 predicted protein [Naegleria gruberi strain NEG-M]
MASSSNNNCILTTSDDGDSIYFVSSRDKQHTLKQLQTSTEHFQKKEYKVAIEILEKCVQIPSDTLITVSGCDFNDGECIKGIAEQADKQIVELIGKMFITKGLCYFNSTIVAESDEKKDLYFTKALQDFAAVARHYKLYKQLYYYDNQQSLLQDIDGLYVFVTTMKSYFLEGRCLQQLRGYQVDGISSLEKAVIAFSEAIQMAEYLKSNSSGVASEKVCLSALEQLPQYYLNRALSHNDINSYRPAEADFTSYISLIGNTNDKERKSTLFMIAYHNRGISLSYMQKYVEAIEDFTKSIEHYQEIPQNSPDKKQQFDSFLETHSKRAKAIHRFIVDHVHDCRDNNDKAMMDKILKLKTLACEDFEFVSKHKPNSVYNNHFNTSQILNMVATILSPILPKEVQFELYSQSIPHLRECIKQGNNYKTSLDLAKALSKTGTGQNEEILDLYNRAVKLLDVESSKKVSGEQKANIFFERGVLYNKMERVEQAIMDFTTSIDLHQQFLEAYFNRAILYYTKSRNTILAIKDLEKVIEIDPKDTTALIELAVLLASNGQVEEGTKRLNQTLECDPNNETAHKYLKILQENESPLPSNDIFEIREDHVEEVPFTIRQVQRPTSDNFGFKLFKKKTKEVDPEEQLKQSVPPPKTRSTNSMFLDNSLPPITSSILGAGTRADFDLPPHIVNLDTDLVWLRPSQITGVTKPALFVDGSNYKDVIQGSLGNCWMLSAMAIVASHDFVMKKVVVESKTNSAIGKYTFCLFKEGRNKEITIDDLIPCDVTTNSYVFSRSADPNELWVPLLEKAYAALYGNYFSLKGGHLKDALVDLTGGISFSYDIDPKKIEEVWQYLSCLPKQNSSSSSFKLMGARSETSASDYTGIINFHAYAILDAIEFPPHLTNSQRVRLIKMKNPWANGIEWKGEWSDYCPRWSPELRKYVGNDFNSQDGIFYMSLEYFVVQWNMIEGVEIFVNGKWNEFLATGRFDSNIRSDNNWMLDVLEETQFFIENPYENNRLVISLTQLDTRYVHDSKDDDSCIAVHLIRVDQPSPSRLIKINKKDIIVQGDYKYDREIVVDCCLPSGSYVAIPHEYFTTNCKNTELGAYTIRILSESKVKVTTINP